MRWSRLFGKSETAKSITCPRCLGKGYVNNDDIIRLNQQGKWLTGSRAYCTGLGKVDKDMLSKIPADATYLNSSLSEIERDELINDFKRDDCPVYESSRLWLEKSFRLLQQFFGKESLKQRKVLVPHFSDFSIHYNGTELSAHETMGIVAAQMEVPVDAIELNFYDDLIREVAMGGPFGGKFYLQSGQGAQYASGLYYGQGENGKFEIWLNRRNLFQPEGLVATLSHEIAHIKLLGEDRIVDNDEPLTDLTTVIFGLGVFNANAAFQTFKNSESQGWEKKGYLSQMQWGYALALFAFIREEKSPAWINYLTGNIKSDFLKAQQFIRASPDTVFASLDCL